jgi:CRISPR-associated protein Csm1
MLERKRGLDKKALPEIHQRLGELLGGGIDKYGSAFKIALFTHLYQYR